MATRKTYVRFVDGPDFVAVGNLMKQPLGRIDWYPRWRQHVFTPYPDVEFTFDCLEDIAARMKSMDEAAKQPALLR